MPAKNSKRAGAFAPGKSGNPKGRPKGVPNKLTSTVKDAVKAAFDELQGDPRANLTAWAKKNPTDFYKLAGKLIPAAVEATLDGEIKHYVFRDVLVDPRNSD